MAAAYSAGVEGLDTSSIAADYRHTRTPIPAIERGERIQTRWWTYCHGWGRLNPVGEVAGMLVVWITPNLHSVPAHEVVGTGEW